MVSYEEKVVDESVAAAWLQFRVRLADHVVDLDDGDCVLLRVEAASVSLQLRARHGEIRATWMWADHTAHPVVDQVVVDPCDVDAYAVTVQRVLLAAGAPHPAFVEVLEGDLVLVDPPDVLVEPAVAPSAPEYAQPASAEQLAGWARLVAAQWLGRDLDEPGDDGVIWMAQGDDRVGIRVGDARPTLEVVATVARGVDKARARKVVARLGAKWHFLSFSLTGDRIEVSVSVNASPFVRDHLDHAIDTVFGYLAHHAPKLRAKVAPTPPGVEVRPRVDPDLVLLFGIAADPRAVVALARDLSQDSTTTLGRWRVFATVNAARARRRSRSVQHGPVRRLLIEQADTWHAVATALETAADEVAGKTASS